MTNDYSNLYFEEYVTLLAEAVDGFVNAFHLNIDEFLPKLVKSGYARQLERRNTKYIVEYSAGYLLSKLLTLDSSIEEIYLHEPNASIEKSPEYWAGYILAIFQYQTHMSFKEINEYLSLSEIVNLYNPYHEANEEKAVELLLNRYHERHKISNLKLKRIEAGLSQRELSFKANVNYRTLQEYEAKKKNINNASVSVVIALAMALHCKVEDIIEY